MFILQSNSIIRAYNNIFDQKIFNIKFQAQASMVTYQSEFLSDIQALVIFL